MIEPAMAIYPFSFDMSTCNTTFMFDFLLTIAKCVQLPCYTGRLTSVFLVLPYLLVYKLHFWCRFFYQKVKGVAYTLTLHFDFKYLI